MKYLILIFLLISIPISSADTYFYAGAQALAVKDSQGDVQFNYYDRLGSDTLTKTLPFGQVIESGDRLGFTGKEQDASGLHYFAARYYDSSIGRFTSVDPVRNNHAYSYVAQNPVNAIDPDGRDIEILSQQNLLEESVFVIHAENANEYFLIYSPLVDNVIREEKGDFTSQNIIDVQKAIEQGLTIKIPKNTYSTENVFIREFFRELELIDNHFPELLQAAAKQGTKRIHVLSHEVPYAGYYNPITKDIYVSDRLSLAHEFGHARANFYIPDNERKEYFSSLVSAIFYDKIGRPYREQERYAKLGIDAWREFYPTTIWPDMYGERELYKEKNGFQKTIESIRILFN